MKEKKRLIRLVKGLCSWCQMMSESGPQSTKIEFLDVMSKANRFLMKLEGNLDELAGYEHITHNEACLRLTEVLFHGHQLHWDQPSKSQILHLCLHLGIRAPAGWHGYFMLKKEEYRLMIRPRKKKWACPQHIREICERNRKT